MADLHALVEDVQHAFRLHTVSVLASVVLNHPPLVTELLDVGETARHTHVGMRIFAQERVAGSEVSPNFVSGCGIPIHALDELGCTEWIRLRELQRFIHHLVLLCLTPKARSKLQR